MFFIWDFCYNQIRKINFYIFTLKNMNHFIQKQYRILILCWSFNDTILIPKITWSLHYLYSDSFLQVLCWLLLTQVQLLPNTSKAGLFFRMKMKIFRTWSFCRSKSCISLWNLLDKRWSSWELTNKKRMGTKGRPMYECLRWQIFR